MNYTPDELEYIEGEEIQKVINYVYIKDKRSFLGELGIFTLKVIILYLLLHIFGLIDIASFLALFGTGAN